jgi:hypothetical protein
MEKKGLDDYLFYDFGIAKFDDLWKYSIGYAIIAIDNT